MIFRWSIWGKSILKNIELLHYSVLSFKKQFGDGHEYVVYTDSPKLVSKRFNKDVFIKKFPPHESSCFCFESKATWQKWCPSPRLDIAQNEFFIDSDVFLLKYPKDIDEFFTNQKLKFAIMDEFLGQPYQHGAMRKKTSVKTPYVNAGFFVQKAGSDITSDLLKEYKWWQKNVNVNEQTHHDEQGALAVALTKYKNSKELYILSKKKYIIISETSNKNIENLDKVTLFHATYPTHPAFYKFKSTLDSIIFDK